MAMMPLSAGHKLTTGFDWNQPYKTGRKMKKNQLISLVFIASGNSRKFVEWIIEPRYAGFS